jgi:biofilm PGA synthesis lipoprotein PgaB
MERSARILIRGSGTTSNLVWGGKLLLAGLLLLTLTPRGFKVTMNHSKKATRVGTVATDTAGTGAGLELGTESMRPLSQVKLTDKGSAAEPIHYRNKAIVLLYHDFANKEADLTITPQKFRNHMEMLRNHHYHVVRMPDFIRFLAGDGKLPPNAVVITSDDGYESFYQYAYPVLKKLGYTATVFPIVSRVGTTDGGSTYSTWDQMKEMKRDGFSFISHSYNLHAMAADAKGNPVSPLAQPVWLKAENRLETEQEYESKVTADLTKAMKLLKDRLGETFQALCLPHGETSQRLLDLAARLGIRYIFTTESGINRPGNTQIKRINTGMPYVTADVLLSKLKAYDEKQAVRQGQDVQ